LAFEDKLPDILELIKAAFGNQEGECGTGLAEKHVCGGCFEGLNILTLCMMEG
jgi:hypothetical protein